MALAIQAQDFSHDSLIWQVVAPENNPHIYFNKPFSTKALDGNVWTCLPLKTRLNNEIVDFGDLFYKTDPQSLTVIDSVFFESDNTYEEYYRNVLFAPHPNGTGYVIAKLSQSKNDQIWLRISIINDMGKLNTNREDIMVPLDNAPNYNLIDIMLEGNYVVLCYNTNGLSFRSRWDHLRECNL